MADGELRLDYQPVVDASGGAVVGAEALVRWQHPHAGLLPPAAFIDHAESSGLIVPLGEWVLRTACAQSAAWAARGHPLQVGVNVSARQLADDRFVATVAGALDDTGLDPASLAVEITERVVMADRERADAVLGDIRALGAGIGIDDFGTGYSSLSVLSGLPLDLVKIDRSFVARSAADQRCAALLEAVVVATLCRRLELTAVAEGVESDADWVEVRRLRIPLAPGVPIRRGGPCRAARAARARRDTRLIP